MPDFLHEITKDRQSRQELLDWQSSISHAIEQQNLTDPWAAVEARNADEELHYSGGPF